MAAPDNRRRYLRLPFSDIWSGQESSDLALVSLPYTGMEGATIILCGLDRQSTNLAFFMHMAGKSYELASFMHMIGITSNLASFVPHRQDRGRTTQHVTGEQDRAADFHKHFRSWQHRHPSLCSGHETKNHLLVSESRIFHDNERNSIYLSYSMDCNFIIRVVRYLCR